MITPETVVAAAASPLGSAIMLPIVKAFCNTLRRNAL
jgi:hypothetical protein